jgi:WD40 repeat protein
LQVVADRLWRDNQPTPETPLGVALVSDVAEVDEALESYYDDRLGSSVAATAAGGSGAGVVSERRVREWFDRSLITANGLRTQIIAEQGEAGEQVAGLPLPLVRLLVDAHLVREENRRGLLWYELAHDRLIEPVRRSNERWRQAHLSRLQQQAALWLAAGRDRSLLLRDVALAQAQAPTADGAGELDADEQAFLQESLAAEQAAQAEARQARRIRNLGYGMAVAGVLALVVAAVAIWQWRAAVAAEARVAEQARFALSRQLSVQSELVVEQSSLSALLAVTAAEVADTPAGRSAVLKTLQANAHVRTILRSVAPPTMAAGLEGMENATDLFTRIVGLAALGNGTVVSARADGLIELWDANRGELLASPFLPSAGKRLAAMVANEEGRRLFLGFVDGTVSWWDLQPSPGESPRFVQVGEEDAGGGEIFQLLPVGEGLLVVTEQGVRRLASLAATPFDGQLAELPVEAWALALDPVAPMLFVGYTSGEVAVLRPEQPHQLLPTQLAQAIYALAWHPDTQQLAVGDWSGNLTLWFLGDVDNPISFFDGNVSEHSLRHLAYSPGGALWVLDVGGNAQFIHQEDGAVLLEGNVLDRVRSATGFTASAARSEENLLFAGTMSGEVFVLSTTSAPYFVEMLPAEIDFGLAAAFSPVGEQVAVASQFSPVQWGRRLPEGQAAPLRPLTWPAAEGFAPQDTALAFAPASSEPPVASDSQERLNLAVGTSGGWIRLYGVWPGDEPLLEFEHVPGSYLNTLDFSPDGRYLLAGSTGGEIDGVVISRTLQLYQLEEPFARWSVAGMDGLSILDTLWAADQQRFYAVAEDGRVAGWDLPQELAGEVTGPAASQIIAGALSLARSPTAGELLVGDGDGRIYRWHPASGAVTQSGSLPGPNAVAQLAYDDATGYIATQSMGDWVQLWDATLEQSLGDQFGYNVMAFGGDKELLTDSLFDSNLWIWPLDTCRLQATACRAANRTLTPAEMRQYNVPEAYADVCAAVLQRCTPVQMGP